MNAATWQRDAPARILFVKQALAGTFAVCRLLQALHLCIHLSVCNQPPRDGPSRCHVVCKANKKAMRLHKKALRNQKNTSLFQRRFFLFCAVLSPFIFWARVCWRSKKKRDGSSSGRTKGSCRQRRVVVVVGGILVLGCFAHVYNDGSMLGHADQNVLPHLSGEACADEFG